MDRVLLFFPQLLKNQEPLLVPLELMALVPGLKEAGFEVDIWDERIESVTPDKLRKRLKDAVLTGVSCRPGGQVPRAFRFASEIRKINQNIPIVFGGWFSSIFREKVTDHPAVDYVISGEGEDVLVTLASALRDGLDTSKIQAVLSKEFDNSSVVQPNPHRFLDRPSPDYMHFDIEPYIGSPREITYISSKGCDAECRFCAIQCQYGQGWYPLPASRVIREISELARQFHLDQIRFVDANFFGDEKRTVSILEGIIQTEGLKGWRAAGRIDKLLEYSDFSWEIIRQSGCYEIEVGIESGSAPILNKMCKNLKKEMIDAFAEKTRKLDIAVTYNFILGYPGETPRDLHETIRKIYQLKNHSPKANFAIYRFSPIPNTELFLECDGDSWAGLPPETIEGSQIYRPISDQDWLEEETAKLVDMLFYCYLPFSLNSNHNGNSGWLRSMLMNLSRYRINRFDFRFPLEWWILRSGTKMGILNPQRFKQWVCS